MLVDADRAETLDSSSFGVFGSVGVGSCGFSSTMGGLGFLGASSFVSGTGSELVAGAVVVAAVVFLDAPDFGLLRLGEPLSESLGEELFSKVEGEDSPRDLAGESALLPPLVLRGFFLVFLDGGAASS